MCITPKRSVGAEVIVIGNPGEVAGIKLTNSVSKGIISGFRSNEEQEMIQTDASVNPGNSGGPMIDKTGHVIGIVNAKIINYGIEGIGFAIPLFEAIPSLGIKFLSDRNTKVDDCGITVTSLN
jgi:serine protease Do